MNTFSKGLVMDLPKLQTPADAYTFALNSILENKNGDFTSLSSEIGNTDCIDLGSTWRIIGSQILDDNTFVLFAVTSTEDNSAILLFDPSTCTTTTLVEDSSLAFSKQYPIDPLFRIRGGCDRVIYFTDALNPYRVINLSSIEDYFEDGNFIVDRINYTPDVSVPLVEQVSVRDGGGRLPVGNYSFAIRYLDGNRNPSAWFYTTKGVNIYSSPTSASYPTIEGGINVVDSLEEPSTVPLTSKSISLSFTNINDNFSYIQVAVLPAITNVGTAIEAFLLPPVQLSSSIQVNVTSLEELPTIPLDEINIPPVNIFKVQAHAQLQNRLFLGGVESKQYLWADFQRAANTIRTRFKLKEVVLGSTQNEGDPKNPLTSFDNRGFMPDEVYALGIRYLFKDGSWSPAFHIPGREASSTDLQILVGGFNYDAKEVRHIPGAETPTGVPRWRVENTSTSTRNLAYHETNTNYPLIDCDGAVFPEGKVRHHRMPSRSSIPIIRIQNSQRVGTLVGLEFDNIDYPSDDIVGHQFVSARSTPSTYTVVDNALLFPPSYDIITNWFDGNQSVTPSDTFSSRGLIKTGLLNTPDNMYDQARLYSPTLQTSNFPLIDYISFRAEYGYDFLYIPPDRSFDYPGPNTSWDINIPAVELTNTSFTTFTNRKVNSQISLQPRSSLTSLSDFDNKDILNLSSSNFLHGIQLEDTYLGSQFATSSIAAPSSKIYNVSLKRDISPFSNLEQLEYYSISSPILDGSSIVFGGDSYLTNFRLVDTYGIYDTDYDGDLIAPPLRGIYADYVNYGYLDSRINFDLLQSGDDDCLARWDFQNDAASYLVKKNLFQEEPGQSAWRAKETPCREYYEYNTDFSSTSEYQPSFSLNTDSTICNSCIDRLPYSIYYSEKSFREEISDSYRTIRPNSVNDIDASNGPITAMFTNKSQLYITTPKSLHIQPNNPQRLTTNEANIIVGTGDVLSIPATILVESPQGYGGCVDKFSINKTEYGVLYVDQLSGRVFLLTDQLKEISAKGIQKFIDNNHELTLVSQLKQQGFTINASPIELGGYISTYDPQHHRLIVTKRDYEALFPIVPLNVDRVSNTTEIYFDGISFYYYNNLRGAFSRITPENKRFFKNKSWSLSYYPRWDVWVSFHSYLPSWYCNDAKTFYSSIGGNMSSHFNGEYQTFYNTKYPHIIEVVNQSKQAPTSTFSSLQICSLVTSNDNYVDETFDQLWMYNDKQSSGLQSVSTKRDDVWQEAQDLRTYRAENLWNINEVRNLYTQNTLTPLSSSTWDDTQDDFFIDKIPSSIEDNLSFFEQSRIRGKFLATRLYYTPTQNNRITTDYININLKPSFR